MILWSVMLNQNLFYDSIVVAQYCVPHTHRDILCSSRLFACFSVPVDRDDFTAAHDGPMKQKPEAQWGCGTEMNESLLRLCAGCGHWEARHLLNWLRNRGADRPLIALCRFGSFVWIRAGAGHSYLSRTGHRYVLRCEINALTPSICVWLTM